MPKTSVDIAADIIDEWRREGLDDESIGWKLRAAIGVASDEELLRLAEGLQSRGYNVETDDLRNQVEARDCSRLLQKALIAERA